MLNRTDGRCALHREDLPAPLPRIPYPPLRSAFHQPSKPVSRLRASRLARIGKALPLGGSWTRAGGNEPHLSACFLRVGTDSRCWSACGRRRGAATDESEITRGVRGEGEVESTLVMAVGEGGECRRHSYIHGAGMEDHQRYSTSRPAHPPSSTFQYQCVVHCIHHARLVYLYVSS